VVTSQGKTTTATFKLGDVYDEQLPSAGISFKVRVPARHRPENERHDVARPILDCCLKYSLLCGFEEKLASLNADVLCVNLSESLCIRNNCINFCNIDVPFAKSRFVSESEFFFSLHLYKNAWGYSTIIQRSLTDESSLCVDIGLGELLCAHLEMFLFADHSITTPILFKQLKGRIGSQLWKSLRHEVISHYFVLIHTATISEFKKAKHFFIFWERNHARIGNIT